MTHADLIAKFEHGLPGEQSHLAFMPFRGSSMEQIGKGITFRDAAVAIILFHNEAGKLCTIVTRRQEYDGSHSGQISFPGGKKEIDDDNLLDTAIRECYEEIGVHARNFEVLKELTPLFVPVSQFLITPYVFYSENKTFEYMRSEREVAAIHELDLLELFKSEVVYLDLKINSDYTLKKVPHFQQEDVLIWGATALILNELKDILV